MIRVLAVLLLASLPLRAEEFPALYAVTGVASDDVLNIRALPDAGSAIIGSLAADAADVEVIEIAGNWALVNTGERAGYAATRYLARRSGPDWTALQTPLSCLGTEPFWSLTIDPGTMSARFSSPETPDASAVEIVYQWPGQPGDTTAAVGLPSGTVVLQPLQCSDGMSDRVYGISADLFRTAPDTSRLSGCCRLVPP